MAHYKEIIKFIVLPFVNWFLIRLCFDIFQLQSFQRKSFLLQLLSSASPRCGTSAVSIGAWSRNATPSSSTCRTWWSTSGPCTRWHPGESDLSYSSYFIKLICCKIKFGGLKRQKTNIYLCFNDDVTFFSTSDNTWTCTGSLSQNFTGTPVASASQGSSTNSRPLSNTWSVSLSFMKKFKF